MRVIVSSYPGVDPESKGVIIQSIPALRTLDSLLCPYGKKALTFSLNSIRLIQTLSMAPSVSVLPWLQKSVLRIPDMK